MCFYISDNTKIEENELAVTFKLNKLMLNEVENQKISDFLKNKVTKDNVLTVYSLAKLYKLPTISELSLIYIERCFPMVVETQNYLHLEFGFIAKILSSSELNIHSEVEIFNALITWLKHNPEERIKYAIELLLKVRFTLLSEHALKYISKCYSIFSKNQKCAKILKEVDINRLINNTSICYTNRYCGQKLFNFLICGGYNVKRNNAVKTVNQVSGSNLNKAKVLSSMPTVRRNSKAVCLKGEVYFFGGRNRRCTGEMSVEKYSPSSNKWSVVTHMFDKRRDFCVCSFMDNIYIIGGYCFQNYEVTNSCLQFDTKEKSWKKIAKMKQSRDSAACVVFQGNIVVSGGTDSDDNKLNSVESYDVFADKWSSMPNTINNHHRHSLVVAKDKLFVIGRGYNNCEIFDNVCKKFVALKSTYTLNMNKALSIGNKIVILQNDRSSVICYDVDKDEWFEESCDATKNLTCFSSVKVPKL